MTDYQDSVRIFHTTFNCPAPTSPTLYPNNDIEVDHAMHDLRVKLIQEELDELEEALGDKDIVEVADAIADILYLAFGAAVSFGIDIKPIFDEVQRSNMSKLDENGNPLFRADGKIMKSKLYSPPDIAPLIERQRKAA